MPGKSPPPSTIAPYFAGPDGPVSEKPYALLREVMKQTEKIGLGKVVLRDREDLVAVFPAGETTLVLQASAILGKYAAVGDGTGCVDNTGSSIRELQMATMLVRADHHARPDRNDRSISRALKKSDLTRKSKARRRSSLKRLKNYRCPDIMSALGKSLRGLVALRVVEGHAVTAKEKNRRFLW